MGQQSFGHDRKPQNRRMNSDAGSRGFIADQQERLNQEDWTVATTIAFAGIKGRPVVHPLAKYDVALRMHKRHRCYLRGTGPYSQRLVG